MNTKDQLKYKRNIDLDLSSRCPIQCPMCWRQTEAQARKRGHDMTMGDFLKVVDFVKSGPIEGFIYFPDGSIVAPLQELVQALYRWFVSSSG